MINYIKTENTQDKSNWIDGEWKDEKDYYYWVDETTNLDCLIIRNPMGGLCGGVGLPKNHKLYGIHYNDDVLWSISVHGGLTYSGTCEENAHICHHVENDDVAHWLGFDCVHGGDYAPGDSRFKQECFNKQSFETYRNLEYVTKEIQSLAQQLVNLGE